MPVDDHFLGLFAEGAVADQPLRVAIQQAVGEKALVINSVPGRRWDSAPATRLVVSRPHSAPAMTVASRQPRSPSGMRGSFWSHLSKPKLTRYPSLGMRCRSHRALNSSTLVLVWK